MRNIVGPQIRKVRYQQGLTQGMLAARCGVGGLDISRGTLSKIEAQLRCVTDMELLVLAGALHTGLETLFPPKRGRKPFKLALGK
jgi:transcriptional regulator with XRE-family HTH domain